MISGIYGLLKDGIIVYVGASMNISQRTQAHRQKGFKTSDVVILQEVEDESKLYTYEKFWIALGLVSGWPLRNMHGTLFQINPAGDITSSECRVNKSEIETNFSTYLRNLSDQLFLLISEHKTLTMTQIHRLTNNTLLKEHLHLSLRQLKEEHKIEIVKVSPPGDGRGRRSVVISLVE